MQKTTEYLVEIYDGEKWRHSGKFTSASKAFERVAKLKDENTKIRVTERRITETVIHST